MFEETVLLLTGYCDTVSQPYRAVIEKPFLQLSKPLYEEIYKLGELTGFGQDICLAMVAIWIAFPLGLIHRVVPGSVLRHVYAMFWGITISFFVFGWQALFAVCLALVTYILLLVTPKKFVGPVTFVVAFGFLALCHIYRMATDYLGWKMDFSVICMLFAMKMTGVALNVADGAKMNNGENISKIHAGKALHRVPSLLEYFSYLYFFPCIISGPVFEMSDYLEFNDNGSGPFDIVAILNRIVWALFTMACFAFGPGIGREKFLSSELDKMNIGETLFYCWFAIFFLRMKYFSGWYWAEATCITTGFGYTTVDDGNLKYPWSKIDQADYIGFEFSSNIRESTNFWNKNVARWLFTYVYTRVIPDPKLQTAGEKVKISAFTRLKGLIATFVVSAFWHGFYGGYYIMWIAMAFANQIHQLISAKITPRILNERRKKSEQFNNFYALLSIVTTQITYSYMCIPFVLLSAHDSIIIFNKFYWSGHILTVFVFLVLLVIPPPSKVEGGITSADTKNKVDKKKKDN